MIRYRLTPWDAKNFGITTAELFFEPPFDNFEQEYIKIENDLKLENAKFIYTRISGEYFELRKMLNELGFYFAESSLTISKSKIQNFEKHKLPQIRYEEAKETDYERVKTIARDSFDYSRFHEDVNISMNLSRERYFNWIEDLINQRARILIGKLGSRTVGFNIQKETSENSESQLILAGVEKGQEIYAASLWNEILFHNRHLGIRKVRAMISASNVGVLNLYMHFGFKVESTLFGFHKKLYP